MVNYNVIFIDDCFYSGVDKEQEKARVELIAIAEKRLSGKVDFTRLTPIDVLTCDDALFDSADLIIVDYRFEVGNEENSVHIRTGNELVSSIRQKARDKPIYLLSVIITEEQVFSRNDLFERFISKEILAEDDFLEFELMGHSELRVSIEGNTIDGIVDVFNCPNDQREDLEGALPDRVRLEIGKVGLTHSELQNCGIGLAVSLHRWILDDFIRYPGLLYDAEYCAMVMGVTLNYFKESIEPDLTDCLYTGVFANTLAKRWWKSLIVDWLIERDSDDQIKGVNDQGAIVDILGVKEAFYSKCVVCAKIFPDAVGYDEDGGNSRCVYPVHIGCSGESPTGRPSPYFKLPRIITV